VKIREFILGVDLREIFGDEISGWGKMKK